MLLHCILTAAWTARLGVLVALVRMPKRFCGLMEADAAAMSDEESLDAALAFPGEAIMTPAQSRRRLSDYDAAALEEALKDAPLASPPSEAADSLFSKLLALSCSEDEFGRAQDKSELHKTCWYPGGEEIQGAGWDDAGSDMGELDLNDMITMDGGGCC